MTGDAGDSERQRPRPQYGEYATPEEQRARIRQPDVTESLAQGTAPGRPAAPVAPAAASAPPTRAAGTRQQSSVDRVITIVLLALGAVNVLFSSMSYLDLATAVTRTMETLGAPGEFTNTAAAQTWGAIAATVLIAGYLITLVAALQRLRTGKTTWWIPVLGAVLTYAIVMTCLSVPLLSDPAFMDYVESLR